MAFTNKEKTAILSLATFVMFADDNSAMTERASFENLQKALEFTTPVTPMPAEEAIKVLQSLDNLTKLRIVLALQKVIVSDGVYSLNEKKSLNQILEAFKLPISMDIKNVKASFYLFMQSIKKDSIIALRESYWVGRLLWHFDLDFDDLIPKVQRLSMDECINTVKEMSDVEKCFFGFCLQQVAASDGLYSFSEASFIDDVFEKTGISVLAEPQKTSFWNRLFQ